MSEWLGRTGVTARGKRVGSGNAEARPTSPCNGDVGIDEHIDTGAGAHAGRATEARWVQACVSLAGITS